MTIHAKTAAPRAIQPQTLPRLGSIDLRFQSYNVEMAEVIGGTFWKPYAADGTVANAVPIQSFEIGKAPGRKVRPRPAV